MSAPETKAEAEALVPLFKLERILNQDQNGRRISLLGNIKTKPALITLERAAFPTDQTIITTFLTSLTNTTNLGANDIYRWYMCNHYPSPLSTTATTSSSSSSSSTPDLKLNLIYPCTPQHIRKYSSQALHLVTETPTIYSSHITAYISRQRTSGRLDWIYNILSGLTEQDDIVVRSNWSSPDNTGFLLLPDLNWDRTSIPGLHLLALVERRDISSLRDLRRAHLPWLREMQTHITTAVAELYAMSPDEVKCYVHYQPTYYHFHIHVVHVMLEAGATQSVGKAFGLGLLIAWLESMGGGDERGLHEVELQYYLGEESELWKACFEKIKNGESVVLNDKV